MKYKKYLKFKDSEVDWLGEIPSAWEARRLGFYFTERREKVSDKDFNALSVTKNGIVPQLDNAAKTDDGDNRKKVCSGDFVINSRSDRKGSSGLSKLTGSVSLINTVIQPKNINGEFSHYLFRSYPFQEEFYRYGKGIVADLWSTNYTSMKNITIPYPPIQEQQQIAKFLDNATQKMDTLIQKQENLIKLLKEKRQAVISHAVTRGLNPDVKFKDSGVEWLGEVPEHWGVSRLKHLTRLIIDGAHFTPTYVDNGIPFLRVTDLHNKIINKEKVKYIPIKEHIELIKRCKPEKGDLLLSKNGTIGLTKIIDWDWDFSIFVSLCLIKFKTNKFLAEYFQFIFQSSAIEEQLFHSSQKTSVTNLHLDKINELCFSVPRIEEQKEIVNYLDEKTQKIDTLIKKATKSIKLLKEKRTALISAAVTGKIDVRELV